MKRRKAVLQWAEFCESTGFRRMASFTLDRTEDWSHVCYTKAPWGSFASIKYSSFSITLEEVNIGDIYAEKSQKISSIFCFPSEVFLRRFSRFFLRLVIRKVEPCPTGLFIFEAIWGWNNMAPLWKNSLEVFLFFEKYLKPRTESLDTGIITLLTLVRKNQCI